MENLLSWFQDRNKAGNIKPHKPRMVMCCLIRLQFFLAATILLPPSCESLYCTSYVRISSSDSLTDCSCSSCTTGSRVAASRCLRQRPANILLHSERSSGLYHRIVYPQGGFHDVWLGVSQRGSSSCTVKFLGLVTAPRYLRQRPANILLHSEGSSGLCHRIVYPQGGFRDVCLSESQRGSFEASMEATEERKMLFPFC
jgi:hypothetical protein